MEKHTHTQKNIKNTKKKQRNASIKNHSFFFLPPVFFIAKSAFFSLRFFLSNDRSKNPTTEMEFSKSDVYQLQSPLESEAELVSQ